MSLIEILIGVLVGTIFLGIITVIVVLVLKNRCPKCGQVFSMDKISSKEVNREVVTKEHRYMQSKHAMAVEFIHTTYAVFDEIYVCKCCSAKIEKTRRKVVDRKRSG